MTKEIVFRLNVIIISLNQRECLEIKGAVSRQSSSFCLIWPITRPQLLCKLN